MNLDEQSLSRALTKRSLDWETQYTYAYSKIVGLQAGGDWVLKKDYVDLVRNQQIYEIPAGREINELLWFMRAELNNSLFDPFMGGFGGFGGTGLGGPGGYAQFGASGSYFMMPAFDVVLRMADRNLKQRLIVGDLTYRITALPEGKKALHLYNVPGGKFDFSNIGFNEYRCWYWYYDTNGDRDDCLAKNPDIVKLPSDIPLEPLNWQDLNTPAQQWVRRWFTAYCKETLGRIWGKYSGNLMTGHFGHLIMDLHFIAAGLLFFHVIVGIDPNPRKVHHLVRVVILLAAMSIHAFFSIALMSANDLIDGGYYQLLDRSWSTDLLSDQKVGAAIGWAMGEIPIVAALIATFIQWMRSDAREAKRADKRSATDLAEYNAFLEKLAAREDK